jgi:hypothetical protein
MTPDEVREATKHANELIGKNLFVLDVEKSYKK